MASPTRVSTCDVLLAQMAEARARSDAVFDIVRPEGLYERPIPERHRIIFYLGYLEAFDGNLFRSGLGALKPLETKWGKLFASGSDPVSGKLPDDQPGDWPECEE